LVYIELLLLSTSHNGEFRNKMVGMIFRFCIDKSFEQTDVAWASLLKFERNIGNFTGWKDHDKYKKAFDDLLKWLKYKTEKEE